MILTKKVAKPNTQNNASSLDSHTYNFTNFSRNNNSNVIWRKWDNKNGTEG